jgi:hypothetical protein
LVRHKENDTKLNRGTGGRFLGFQSEEAPSLAMKLKNINLRQSGPNGKDRPPAAGVLLLPARHQARGLAGFGAAPYAVAVLVKLLIAPASSS